MAITRRLHQVRAEHSGRRLRSGTVVVRSECKKGVGKSPKPSRRRLDLSVAPGATEPQQAMPDGRDFSRLMVVEGLAPEDPVLAPASPESLASKVGLPEDDRWEVVGALERRFCFVHGKHELLLQLEDTWLRPDDLKIVDAVSKLESRKKSDAGRKMKAGRKVRGAECNSRLWSQIDLVKGEKEVNGVRCFEIQWRPHWFQEDEKTVNLDWAKESLETRLQLKRRSGRNHDQQTGATDGQRAILTVLGIE